MDTKFCKKCQLDKPIGQFGTCRGKPAYRCLECQSAYNKEYAKNNPTIRKAAQKRYIANKSGDQNFKDKQNEHHRAVLRRRKLLVLTHYSGGKPCCACCKTDELEFLVIDHIDGGGNQHRREIGGSGRLYGWLKRNGFPPGFRVLCCNCNHAYGAYGCCPHQKNNNAASG